MEKILMRLMSFLAFDLPFKSIYIQQTFVVTHESYSNEYHGWSPSATRKKVIGDYWIKHALLHFSAFYVITMLIFLLLEFNDLQLTFPGCLLAGLISLLVLDFGLYGQLFYFDFLPLLDTIMENYEGRRLQHLKKCQKAQMSNFSAAVVYYAFTKVCGLKLPTINRQYGERLTDLFGKDPDDMQKALKLITCKVTSLSPHKQTEIEKSMA